MSKAMEKEEVTITLRDIDEYFDGGAPGDLDAALDTIQAKMREHDLTSAQIIVTVVRN